MAGVLTGVAWYRRSEWPLLLSLAADPEALATTYDEWLVVAEQTYARLRQEGYLVEKVEVELAEMLGWCAVHNRSFDESARSAFVADKLRRREESVGNTEGSAPGPAAANNTEAGQSQ